MRETTGAFIDSTARVEHGAVIGAGTRVWARTHVRSGARIGRDCVIGSGVTVDLDVVIGDRCKVQNGALIYKGVQLGDGVFVGPAAVLTNDRHPRAITPDDELLSTDDWQLSTIVVGHGASIGANATVVAEPTHSHADITSAKLRRIIIYKNYRISGRPLALNDAVNFAPPVSSWLPSHPELRLP